MLNLVVVLLCAPVLASCLDLADLPRSHIIEEIAKCRATCIETFIVADMENRIQQSWDQTCRNNRDCRMCWSFCTMLEHNVMPDNVVCYDDFYCFKGCQVACQFQNTKNRTQDVLSKDVGYTSLPSLPQITQDKSTVHWSPPSSEVSIYTVFVEKDNEWTYLDQICDESLKLPLNEGPMDVAVLASNKSSVVAMASLSFQPPPFVPEAAPIPYPIRKVRGPIIGPLRSGIRVKTFRDEHYVSVEDLKKILKIEDVATRQSRSHALFNWDLRVTEMRHLGDDLVEMELRWNHFPEAGGMYWVRISSAPDVFQPDNKAIIVVPRQHTVKIQVEYRKHRMISRSPELNIDLFPESVEKQTVGENNAELMIGAVVGSFLFIMLIMAGAFIYWTRTVKKLSTGEEAPKNYVMEVATMKSIGTSTKELPYSGLPAVIHGASAKIDERLQKFAVQLTPVSKEPKFKFPPDGFLN